VNKSYPVNLMSPMRRAAEPTIYASLHAAKRGWQYVNFNYVILSSQGLDQLSMRINDIGEHSVKISSYSDNNCRRRSNLKNCGQTDRQTDRTTDRHVD